MVGNLFGSGIALRMEDARVKRGFFRVHPGVSLPSREFCSYDQLFRKITIPPVYFDR